jgi:hypothetical protein
VQLEAGHYEFTGQARTRGQVDNGATSGVVLRISAEKKPKA